MEAEEAVEGLVFGERTVLCLSCELQFDRSDLNSVQAGGQSAWFCPECGRRCQTAQDWLAAQNLAGEKAFAGGVWVFAQSQWGDIFSWRGFVFFDHSFYGNGRACGGDDWIAFDCSSRRGERWLFIFVFEERCCCVFGRREGFAGLARFDGRAGCFGAVAAVGCLAGVVFGAGFGDALDGGKRSWLGGFEFGFVLFADGFSGRLSWGFHNGRPQPGACDSFHSQTIRALFGGLRGLGRFARSSLGRHAAGGLFAELDWNSGDGVGFALFFDRDDAGVGLHVLRQSGKTALAWIGQDGFAQEAMEKMLWARAR